MFLNQLLKLYYHDFVFTLNHNKKRGWLFFAVAKDTVVPVIEISTKLQELNLRVVKFNVSLEFLFEIECILCVT